MSRAAAAVLLALAVLLSIALAPRAASADALIWRLEQPPPPAGVPFNVPLGAPGDLAFWAPNRGLMTVEGNSTIARGIYVWNGQSWRQLATVCGGPAETARIAWAGPEEFWVVSEPSLPRAGSGLALCRFKDGQVAGSWSTRVDATDPFRQMLSATCDGPNDCWFGGVGSQDALGTRIGAFHLHWNGSDLESVYGPQGRAVSDMQFHAGAAVREHLRRAGAGEPRRSGRPGRTGAGAEAAAPDRRQGLRQRRLRPGAAGGSSRRRQRAAGARQRRHRPLGGRRWRRLGALRTGRRRGRAGAAGGAPGRRRLRRGAAERRRLRPDRPARRRRRDARQRAGAGHGRPVRRAPQRQRQGDGGGDLPRRQHDDDAAAGLRRRPRQRRADRLPGCERLLDGDLGRLGLPLQRRQPASRSTPTPTSRKRSTSGPTRRPNSSSPTRCRPTTPNCSPRRRPKRRKRGNRRPAGCRRCCGRSARSCTA